LARATGQHRFGNGESQAARRRVRRRSSGAGVPVFPGNYFRVPCFWPYLTSADWHSNNANTFPSPGAKSMLRGKITAVLVRPRISGTPSGAGPKTGVGEIREWHNNSRMAPSRE
jgi:hypothetical protein